MNNLSVCIKAGVLFLLGMTMSYFFSQLDRDVAVASEVTDPAVTGYRTPQRIITLAPLVTETVFALGGGQQIIGVSEYCDYPPEVSTKVNVGGIFNPNFERIRSLKPDMVIVLGQGEKIADYCRRNHIRFLAVKMADMKGLYEDTLLLGRILGRTEQAKSLCARIFNDLLQVRARTAGKKPRRVFFSMLRTPGSLSGLETIGPGTCLNELIEYAGGINIFNDLTRPYSQVSKETLLKRRPEIIIEPQINPILTEKKRQQLMAQWQAMAELPAVKNGRIYFPPEDLILRPGPRIGQVAAQLADFINND